MERSRSDVRRHLPLLLLAALLLSPIMAIPETGAWAGMRAFGLQAVAFGLLVVLLGRINWAPEGVKTFLRTGPNLPLVLLVAWAGLSFLTNTPTVGTGRALAQAELIRLGAGAIIFFAVVYRASSRDHLKLLSYLLLAGGVIAALAGLVTYSESEKNVATAFFPNAQLLAAFLVLLLPVAIVFAQQGPMDARRILASAATVCLLGALLLTNNRSAWLGAIIGMMVTTGLTLRGMNAREVTTQKHRFIAPIIAILAACGLFFTMSGAGTKFSERASTLATTSNDASFQWRRQMWSNALTMIGQKPLNGWGVGQFGMVLGDFDETAPPRNQVEREGVSLTSIPHNEYLQIGAELGLVGLALYLAVLGAFFYRGVKSLPRITGDTRKWLLVAAMGGIAAQMVDAIGNPGWRFGDVSPLFWLILGVGMACTRTHRERQDHREGGNPERVPARPRLARLAWQGMAAVFALGLVSASYATHGKGRPRGFYDPTKIAMIAYKPGMLDFRWVKIGKSKVKRLWVKNIGEPGSLLEGSFSVEGEGFTLDMKTTPIFALRKGEKAIAYVRFTPQRTGNHFGLLRIRTINNKQRNDAPFSDPDKNNFGVNLFGGGKAP